MSWVANFAPPTPEGMKSCYTGTTTIATKRELTVPVMNFSHPDHAHPFTYAEQLATIHKELKLLADSLNGLVTRCTSEILDSVKAEYGSKLKFVTIAELAAALDRQSTSVDEPVSEFATRIELMPNVPNPFNPSTVIGNQKSEIGTVRLTVHDLLGREVAVLVDGVIPAGEHSVRFDATTLPSGVYLYRLESGGTVISRKMVLLK